MILLVEARPVEGMKLFRTEQQEAKVSETKRTFSLQATIASNDDSPTKTTSYIQAWSVFRSRIRERMNLHRCRDRRKLPYLDRELARSLREKLDLR